MGYSYVYMTLMESYKIIMSNILQWVIKYDVLFLRIRDTYKKL